MTAVESVTLTQHGMRGTTVHEIVCKDGKAEVRLCREGMTDGKKVLVPQACASAEIQTIVGLMNTCGVLSWDGFHGKHPRHVCDGIMFTFTATVNGGQTIRADGSANFPKGYREFVRTLNAMLAENGNH